MMSDQEEKMDLLESINKDFPIVEKSAKEFLKLLPGGNIVRDISLAAELCGLLLLRASHIDLTKLEPGCALLGVIPDETYTQIQKFMFAFAHPNGISGFKLLFSGTDLHQEMKAYHPQVSRLEAPFDAICKRNAIKAEQYPFVALFGAMIYVVTGNQMKILDARVGMPLTMYHVIAGSKTIPYPLHSIPDEKG
jgi:hypothetical protein